MSKDKVFFKFELDVMDLFQLSALLAAVSFKQEKVIEELRSDADRFKVKERAVETSRVRLPAESVI